MAGEILDNTEAIEAWDGPLFDRFVRFRDIVTTGLGAHVERAAFEEDFDLAFSRFGTMFFANPVNALRNVRRSLRPGGRLCMVVWRRKLDNDWMHRAEVVVSDYLTKPEDYDE